jgi:hypothetical protein
MELMGKRREKKTLAKGIACANVQWWTEETEGCSEGRKGGVKQGLEELMRPQHTSS